MTRTAGEGRSTPTRKWAETDTGGHDVARIADSRGHSPGGLTDRDVRWVVASDVADATRAGHCRQPTPPRSLARGARARRRLPRTVAGDASVRRPGASAPALEMACPHWRANRRDPHPGRVLS